MKNKKIIVKDIGRTSFSDAWKYQEDVFQKIIDQKVSEQWKEINVSYLNGEDDNQIKQAFDETLTPPFGEGARVIILKNNPLFTNKNEEIVNNADSFNFTILIKLILGILPLNPEIKLYIFLVEILT